MRKLICVCVVGILFTLVESQRSCTTPNQQRARCIPLRSCTLLFDAIYTRNQQQLRFLRESRCGGQSNNPSVCCGTYDNYVNTGADWEQPEDDRPSWGDPTSGRPSKLPDRSTCGFQVTDRILSGQETDLTAFPWMALLQYRKSNGALQFSCGGTLISSRWVLTAGHCVKGQILTKIGPLVGVRLGEYNIETERDCVSQFGYEMCNDQPFDSRVAKSIVHTGYNDLTNDRYDDIALLKLETEAPITDFIKPICLPGRNEGANIGEQLIVAGWGKTEYASSSPVKLQLRVPAVDISQCAARFRTAGINLGTKQICAGGQKNKDSCSGDSGGPLMTTTRNDTAQWYIEGIVSFGAKCGSAGWPGVYTKVAQYIPWIENNID